MLLLFWICIISLGSVGCNRQTSVVTVTGDSSPHLKVAPTINLQPTKSNSTVESTKPSLALTNTTWTLIQLSNLKSYPSSEIEIPWFQISDELHISGISGINRFSGSIQIPAPGDLEIGQINTTLMAGPEASMKLERQFLDSLCQVKHYEIDGTELKLQGETGNLLMICTMISPSPNNKLENK